MSTLAIKLDAHAVDVSFKNDALHCSGLMYPDTDLGENARDREVFDE